LNKAHLALHSNLEHKKSKQNEKLLVVALLAAVSTGAFATTGEGEVKITNDSTSVFKVHYTKPVKSKVKVEIFNEEGARVYTETIAKGTQGFVRPYNLSKLPKGVYTFKVTDKNDVSTFEFNYAKTKPEQSVMMALINKLDNDRVFVALSNKDKSTVNINIIKNGKTVYTSKEVVNGQFAQLFNLQDIVLRDVEIRIYESEKLIKEASF